MKKNDKIDDILLENRQLFLFNDITEASSKELIKNLIGLSILNLDPITLHINSCGGDMDSGFAIVDVIKKLKAPVNTIVIGVAASMAGIISIIGKKRYISEHSIWMSHDMSGGVEGDYTSKVIDRVRYLEKEQKKMFKFIKKYTKLTNNEIKKAITGELWLSPKECLEKGIADKIIK